MMLPNFIDYFIHFALFSHFIDFINAASATSEPTLFSGLPLGKLNGTKWTLNLDRTTKAEVYSFLGIPYAKKPTGKLRFAKPVPPNKWSGTFDATKLPNACMQIPDTIYGNFSGSDMWNPNTEISEDCLYLNIWVPGEFLTDASKKDAAVMIWIYGGGFIAGSASLDIYNGKWLAAHNKVIVVSMQYRVGAYGFFYLPNTPELPGNVGLYDQRLAFQWVKDNIGYFGGNDESITLFGESAGGTSIGHHIVSEGSNKLFQRAIMESSASDVIWGLATKDDAIRRTMTLAKGTGCSSTDRFIEGTEKKITECLLKLPAQEINDASWFIDDGYIQMPFMPFIDGEFLRDHPMKLLKTSKRAQEIPTLLGVNKNEGTYFSIYASAIAPYLDHPRPPTYDLPLITNGTWDIPFVRRMLPELTKYYPMWPHETPDFMNQAILRFYLPRDPVYPESRKPFTKQDAVTILEQAMGDFVFACSVVSWADTATAGPNINPRVFFYKFQQRSSRNPWPEWFGVIHGEEMSFVFGQPAYDVDGKYSNEDARISRNIMAYFTNFAKTGNPNEEGNGRVRRINIVQDEVPIWNAYDQKDKKFLYIQPAKVTINGKVYETKNLDNTRPHEQACQFWTKDIPQMYRIHQERTGSLRTSVNLATTISPVWSLLYISSLVSYLVV